MTQPVNYGNKSVPGENGTIAAWGQTVLLAGQNATVRTKMSLRGALSSVAGAVATWELIDDEGAVYLSGAATLNTRQSDTAPGTIVYELGATITAPANIPVSGDGTDYQVRWNLSTPGTNAAPTTTFTSIRVVLPTFEHVGAVPLLEFAGSPVSAILTLAEEPESEHAVTAELFNGNESVFTKVVTGTGLERVWEFDPAQLGVMPSITPRTILWRVKKGNQSFTFTAEFWLINATISQAANDVQQYLNRGFVSMGLSPNSAITQMDVVRYMRLGADAFNGKVRPTNFFMTNATGAIRDAWIAYSCIAACRSQYLDSGLKAFNYSGNSTQLDYDPTQYWESLASSIEGQVDQNIKMLKDNLAKWGHTGGPGDVSGPSRNNVGVIGLSSSLVSNFRNYNIPGISGGGGGYW